MNFKRELGIALKALQEKMASSHVDGGISWFFSSCGGRLGTPLQVPRGTQGASRVALGKSSLHLSCEGECSGVMAGESGLNSRGSGNLKVFLELWQEVWVPLSCHGDLREHLMWSLGSQECFQGVRCLKGFLLSWYRGLGPHLELRQEIQGSSQTLTGILGFLWRSHWGVRCHLMLGHGTPLPSPGGKGVSHLLSS